MQENSSSAIAANDTKLWGTIWETEGDETWRAHVLSDVYQRIVNLCPRGKRVIDLGGGLGILGAELKKNGATDVFVAEHNHAALAGARKKGLGIVFTNLETDTFEYTLEDIDVVISTEVLEHLSDDAVHRILKAASKGVAFFSVPNDRLGPDEEPQHARKWTALSFLQLLRQYWPDARVEVLGPDCRPGVPAFLLGVCGLGAKCYTLSMTLPVRDEAADLETVLASFRGVADEIVVGIDPRTTDRTREIARAYAEVVFEIENPRGPNPEEDHIPENGVHFSWCRNQCIDKCSSKWVFMTEGHERLKTGADTLRALAPETMDHASVIFVWRTGQGQRWGFPWMFKKSSKIRFVRPTHNQLDYPEDVGLVKLPLVQTLHLRDHDNAAKRAKQRKVQNRITLLDDWKTRGNSDSLYYLASEMREHNPVKACERMEEFIAAPRKNGPARYQTRLQLAREYAEAGQHKKAREHLLLAAHEDWSRIEHWVWLGDLAFEDEQLAQALQFYRYAATAMGDPPFSLWWIDDDMYTYLPAQRLAMTYAALGNLELAIEWAKKVPGKMPSDAPQEALDEANNVVAMLEKHQQENAHGYA